MYSIINRKWGIDLCQMYVKIQHSIEKHLYEYLNYNIDKFYKLRIKLIKVYNNLSNKDK